MFTTRIFQTFLAIHTVLKIGDYIYILLDVLLPNIAFTKCAKPVELLKIQTKGKNSQRFIYNAKLFFFCNFNPVRCLLVARNPGGDTPIH